MNSRGLDLMTPFQSFGAGFCLLYAEAGGLTATRECH